MKGKEISGAINKIKGLDKLNLGELPSGPKPEARRSHCNRQVTPAKLNAEKQEAHQALTELVRLHNVCVEQLQLIRTSEVRDQLIVTTEALERWERASK